MTTKYIKTLIALLATITCAATFKPPSIIMPPLPTNKSFKTKIIGAGNTTIKGATKQMIDAKTSFAINQPLSFQTNFITIGLYTGLDYDTNHVVTIQAATTLTNIFTNTPYSFKMNDTNVSITIRATNKTKFFRLMWIDDFGVGSNTGTRMIIKSTTK